MENHEEFVTFMHQLRIRSCCCWGVFSNQSQIILVKGTSTMLILTIFRQER